jgi:serine/threonine protein kinase
MGLHARADEKHASLGSAEFHLWKQLVGTAVECTTAQLIDAFVAFVRQNSDVVRAYQAWWTAMPEAERESKRVAQWMLPEQLHLPFYQRYKGVKLLQNSLFGQVQLMRDLLTGSNSANKEGRDRRQFVAVKLSDKTLSLNKKSLHNVVVMEDVRREAHLLRTLVGPQQMALPLLASAVDLKTCGLSGCAATMPTSLNRVARGRTHIAHFIDEAEDDNWHYLVTEYVERGDLFTFLVSQPCHKVSEAVARRFFHHICLAVRYLHTLSIVHTDLSLENMCCDRDGVIKLIDFGLARQHPAYTGDKRVTNSMLPSTAGTQVRLFSELKSRAEVKNECESRAASQSKDQVEDEEEEEEEEEKNNTGACDACFSSHPDDVALGASKRMRFLCAPVCSRTHKPGKLGYMSPELHAGRAWDAYANDMYALGVILYSMLTGRPPYTTPNDPDDAWFTVIYSGQWLLPQVRSQSPAAIYNSLSPAALDLINSLIKPQHKRPTIDQVLAHDFFRG